MADTRAYEQPQVDTTMKSINNIILNLLVAAALLILSGCGSKPPSLVVTRITHFLVQGNGESLNFPLFAETISIETIERDLAIAEYYHKKLAELYSFKSFNLIDSEVNEYLIRNREDLGLPHSIYQYSDSLASIELSLVGFESPQADYSFRITDQANHQTRHHQVSVQNDQSASIGLLFDVQNNRGYFIVIQLFSMTLEPDVTPQEFADFLKHKNSIHDEAEAVDYVPGDQKWMDELFGNRAIPVPAPPSPPPSQDKVEQIDYDTPPAPVGGYIAFKEAFHYPPEAKQEGRQGRVLLKAYIDEQGNVAKSEILKSAYADLDSAALETIRSVRFTPALKDSVPISVWVTIPLDFKLK